MDVFRTPSSPSTSDILPTYTLQESTAALAVDQLQEGEVPSSSPSVIVPPPPPSSNPWAREKAPRRDLSEYRNSVVLVDEQSGEVIGVLGREGEVVLDEEEEEEVDVDEHPSSSASSPQEPEGSASTLSSQAVVGICPPLVAQGSEITTKSNDFFVDPNDTPTSSSLSPSLQRGLNLLDRKTGPIEPYQPAPTPVSPSILLTPSPSSSSSSILDGLPAPPPVPPPTPIFPSSQRPSSSHFQDLRNSPSDISLRTLLSPNHQAQAGLPELGPSGTTIRRVHSRRMRSGTVTSVGGSSFYTAREATGTGGTWRGSMVGGGGSVRGAILGEGEGGTTVGRKGATIRGGGGGGGDKGEVLLRFFEERESVFVASQTQTQTQPPTSSPLANTNASPESTTSSLPSEELLTPTDSSSDSSFWSYFSLPSQPLAGASLMFHASKDFLWGMMDFSSSSEEPSPPSASAHGRYRSSFYYHLPPIDPDSLESTVRVKRARIPTDYGLENGEARRADVWHVDDLGVGRRAWIGAGGGMGLGAGAGEMGGTGMGFY